MKILVKTYEKPRYHYTILQTKTEVIDNRVVIQESTETGNLLKAYIEDFIEKYVSKMQFFSVYEIIHDSNQTSAEVRLEDNIDGEPVGEDIWLEVYYWNVGLK